MVGEASAKEGRRSASLIAYRGKRPKTAKSAFVAPGATLIGDVEVGEGASVWFNAVLRADYEPIFIGRNTNIQDGVVVHIDRGFPTRIGESVTVGHAAVVHGADVGDRSLIGMNSTLLTGSKIGSECLVAAGAVVRENAQFGDRALIAGVPAKQIGEVTDQMLDRMARNTADYVNLAAEYLTASSDPD